LTTKAADITDEEILQLLNNTRTFERGFRQLMARYQERLYWHIRRMVQDHADADDVLQNTMIKVHRGISNFKGNSKLYTWLYRIATNESLSFIQSKSRKATQGLDDPESSAALQLSADAWFDGDDLQRRLHEAIAQLPEKQRVVFNMRYFEEMPYEEMSAVLDTSVGALKASFHHAAKKIEAIFRESEDL
jgi:RNA polymerase sigma-70 factor (ECF subfamily)